VLDSQKSTKKEENISWFSNNNIFAGYLLEAG
jgi:hypothetical protein